MNNTLSTPRMAGTHPPAPESDGFPPSVWGVLFRVLGIIATFALIAWMCLGCEPYVEGNASVGVERGDTNDVHRTDVDVQGKFEGDF